jgi:hypothetical protein
MCIVKKSIKNTKITTIKNTGIIYETIVDDIIICYKNASLFIAIYNYMKYVKLFPFFTVTKLREESGFHFGNENDFCLNDEYHIGVLENISKLYNLKITICIIDNNNLKKIISFGEGEYNVLLKYNEDNTFELLINSKKNSIPESKFEKISTYIINSIETV